MSQTGLDEMHIVVKFYHRQLCNTTVIEQLPKLLLFYGLRIIFELLQLLFN